MKYDITLKTLLMDGAPAFLMQRAGTPDMALAAAEFPAVVFRRVDLLGTLPDHRMLHTEVQSGNDPTMPRRMLGYYWMILEANPQADVVQIVLYIGAAPLRIANGIARTGLSLSYRVIDIRTLDPAPLLASAAAGDIVTSFLCRADDIEARVRDILQRLLSLRPQAPSACDDGISRLVLLGGLRGAAAIIDKEIRAMPIEINIENNPILKDIFTRVQAEGEARGEAKGKAESLLRLIERRFGPVPAGRREQVAGADIATLDLWLDRLFDAPTLDAVFEGP